MEMSHINFIYDCWYSILRNSFHGISQDNGVTWQCLSPHQVTCNRFYWVYMVPVGWNNPWPDLCKMYCLLQATALLFTHSWEGMDSCLSEARKWTQTVSVRVWTWLIDSIFQIIPLVKSPATLLTFLLWVKQISILIYFKIKLYVWNYKNIHLCTNIF